MHAAEDLLGLPEQVLVQLLAGAQAGVDDVDAPPRLGDEATGDVIESDRLAHVEHEDLTVATGLLPAVHGGGLDDQLDGLMDGHEVAGHVRVGDRHRAAGLDLGPEGVQHRTPAPEHVPEPHRDERPGGALGEVGRQALGDALRVAEDAGGIGRLVGRDVDELLDADVGGGGQQLGGEPHVALDRLAGEALQQGQVLEGGGVEDHVGPPLPQEPLHPVPVAEVEEDQVGRVEQRPSLDRELDGVEGRFVAVHHDEVGRVEAGDLPAQLRADRAAGAGDQDPLAPQVIGDRGDVGVDRLAAEKVLGGGRADVADGDAAADELAHPGEDLDVEADIAGLVGQLPDQVGRGAGQRHQQGVGLVLVGRLGHPAPVAHDRHAHDPQVPLGGVVVEQRHRQVGARRVPQQGGDDLGPGVAGPEHEQPVDVGSGRAAALLVIAADQIPGRTHQDEGDDPAADDDAQGDEPVRLAQEQQRTDARHRAGQRRDLVEAAEPPAAEVEAGGQPHQDLGDNRRRNQQGEPGPVDAACVEVVAEEHGAEQPAGPGQRVRADAPLKEQKRQPRRVHAAARCHGPIGVLLHRYSLRPGPASPPDGRSGGDSGPCPPRKQVRHSPLATFGMGRIAPELFPVGGLCGGRAEGLEAAQTPRSANQSTVWRRPSARLTFGCQPRSRAAAVMSAKLWRMSPARGAVCSGSTSTPRMAPSSSSSSSRVERRLPPML